jgi:hypothetical protein
VLKAASMGKTRLLFWATLVVMGLPEAAAADPVSKSSARRHYALGVDLAKEDSYVEALAEFRRAYALSPHFSVLYNIGQASVALDLPVEAVEALSRYLQEGGEKIAPARRLELEAAIARQRGKIGELEISTNVDGAHISVDGDEIGTAPLPAPVRLAAGVHRVSVSSQGRATREQTLTLAGEEQHRLELLLPELPPPLQPPKPGGKLRIVCARWAVGFTLDGSPAKPLPLGQPVGVQPGKHRLSFLSPDGQFREQSLLVRDGVTLEVDCGLDQAVRRRTADTTAPRPSHPTLGYALGGAGALLTVAALAHFAWNLGRYQTWRSNQDQLNADSTAPDYSSRQQENNELAESLERTSRVTVGLAVAGVAGLGAGTWFLWFDRGPGAEHAPGRMATLGWRGLW